MPDLVHLQCGDLSLQLAPQFGGSIASFRCGKVDLLRPMGAAALTQGNHRESSCFPLLPYSNRIGQGRFCWNGRSHALLRTSADLAHAIHGNARHAAWRIDEVGRNNATLTLGHTASGDGLAGPEGWPWPYQATQSFTLSSDTLTVILSLENRADTTMPAGLGWHPFFPRRRGLQLQFQARQAWLNGPDLLPEHGVPASALWPGGDQPHALPDTALDNCFAGWNSRARLLYPAQRIAIQLACGPLLRHLVVYAPPERDFFAFEPVSHLSDAVNRTHPVRDHGLKCLEPGGVLRVSMTLAVHRDSSDPVDASSPGERRA